MGILEFVHNDHAGLIPRALAQIFEYTNAESQRTDFTITLSFLQLYRETIQDLLIQANNANASTTSATSTTANNGKFTELHKETNPYDKNDSMCYVRWYRLFTLGNDDNLLIREDPARGFYVEGLQEFVVRDYFEAGENTPFLECN